MELDHGRGDRYQYRRGEDQEGASKDPSLTASSSSFSLACVPHAEAAARLIETEHMFDKVVTPSDVGKLNRLVIPKQYAEKYFPLDPSMADKCLSLCFEDSTGKPWPFRYSYWNSSQSYVMTKGWSRFVKDKRLDAGDTISFSRGVGEASHGRRLFIDWRRRPNSHHHFLPLPSPVPMQLPFAATITPFAGLFTPPVPVMRNAPSRSIGGDGSSYIYFQSVCPRPVQVGDGRLLGVPMVLDSIPVVHGAMETKRVRLFGVNLECSKPEDRIRLPLTQPKPPQSPLQWSIGTHVGALESTVVSTKSKLQ